MCASCYHEIVFWFHLFALAAILDQLFVDQLGDNFKKKLNPPIKPTAKCYIRPLSIYSPY